MKYFIFSVILMFAGNSFSQQQLYINEVMGDNNNVIESGSYDWIELYNPNGNIVNLNGWYLSDDPKNPQKWKFPKAKIQANSFFTIHLSGVKSKSKKEVHANFKLDANGEILLLSNSKGLIIDCFQSIPCSKGISYGRCNDGSLSFERFLKPTKQKSNNSSNGILFSHQPGFYNYFFELELKSKQGDSIRYTEDGSLPNQHSKLYRSKININSRQDQIDTLTQLSNNRTSNRNTKSIKGYVIRAATFKKGKRSSKIYSKSYFTFPKITDKYKGFNVVSLITDQNNLFQKDTGIYIGNEVSSNANYNKRGSDWQRQAFITVFDTVGAIDFSQAVDIRIHGQGTRKYASKSFRIYANKQYQSPVISTSVFNNSRTQIYNKIMLKASMGDLQKTVFKDELTSYICRNLNVDVPDYAPCILFINGEYWGIHNLREFTSKQYISKKYNVNKDSINILTLDTGRKYNLNKSITNNPMLRLVYNHARTVNFKDSSSYRIINRFFNIESIIDFYCTNLFFANTDYLKNNNKLWQVTKNGKWHQFLYDLDYCWTNAKIDNISPIINQDNYVKNTSHPSLLLTIILINPITKTKFLKRMNYLMENDFSTKKLLKAISLFKKNYKPQMRMHTNRWSRPGSVSQWEKKVSYLEGFARTRHSYFRKHLLKLQ